jgi:SsrA-binding protein|tara:strand:+ start:145 stop:600 length:456 start_codon:yes stop_codon:yes gene_type:complete
MGKSIVSTNRKAYHEFQIIEILEAGLELLGSEVKSLREGKASLKESYIKIRKGQAWMVGVHISAYSHTGFSGHEPLRDRRLLLHKNEIYKINQKLSEKGLTALPLKLYFNKQGWLKVEIGLAKGKKLYDKRDTKKRRDIERDIQREMKKTL